MLPLRHRTPCSARMPSCSHWSSRVSSLRHRAIARPPNAEPPALQEPPSTSTSSFASQATVQASTTHANGNGADAQCFATGDSVVCEVPADEPPQCFEVGDSVVCEVPPDAASAQAPASLLETALLVFPFFAWGTSMPALKLVMPHVSSPLLLGSLRLLPASLILVAWAAATGRKHPSTLQAWGWIFLFGLVDGAAFQGFLAEGLTRTSAGLGSVIIDSQPLTVAVLAALLFGERLGPTAVSGLLLGVLGLLLVELPPEMWTGLINGGIDIASGGFASLPDLGGVWRGGLALGGSGEFYMLLAAQSMALGTVMVRYVTRHADSVYATGYHMLLGGLVLLASVAVTEPAILQASWEACTPSDYATLAYISVLGGAASYGIFFYNASVKGNLTALSSLTFLTPLFAVAGGYLALGETLTPLQVCGAAVTLAAVYLITNKAPASK